jgi:hypothetical protein
MGKTRVGHTLYPVIAIKKVPTRQRRSAGEITRLGEREMECDIFDGDTKKQRSAGSAKRDAKRYLACI